MSKQYLCHECTWDFYNVQKRIQGNSFLILFRWDLFDILFFISSTEIPLGGINFTIFILKVILWDGIKTAKPISGAYSEIVNVLVLGNENVGTSKLSFGCKNAQEVFLIWCLEKSQLFKFSYCYKF